MRKMRNMTSFPVVCRIVDVAIGGGSNRFACERLRMWLGLTGMVAVVAALVFGGTAQAVTVNLSPAWVEAAEYSGLGAAPDAPGNTVWNTEPIRGSVFGPNDGTARTQSNLLASDGSPTNIGWTITGFWNDLGHISPHPDKELFHTSYWNEYRDAPAGQLEFFGLNDAVPHDVYIYSMAKTNTERYGGEFTIGGTTLIADTTPHVHDAFVEGDNYVKFSNVVPSGGSILVSMEEYRVGSEWGKAWIVSGFQIQEVPEPTSLILLALGGATFVALRRRW
jgi:hypothetical protein